MKEYILAIETGGTKLQMAIGTSEGEILYNYRTRIYPENGCQGILEDIIKAFPLLNDEALKRDGKISKIGIGFGGPVDSNKGMVIASVQVRGWENFSVMDYFMEKVGIPAYIYNDSNAATWGEYCKGAGQGTRNFFYTNMGSGVGGGLVIDGKLYNGQGNGAAELGQTWLCDYGRNNRPRKVEDMCSGWSIEQQLRHDTIPDNSLIWKLCEGRQEHLTCQMLGEAVRAGDAYAIQFLDHITEIFAIALSNVSSMFSPECIAIGGGVSLIGDPLIERLRKYIKPYIFVSNTDKYRIEKSQLDESIVLVGTLLLTAEK